MRKSPIIALMSLILLIACAPAAPKPQESNSMPMQGMTTVTPGSMIVDNPDAAHTMEPITDPNVQPATDTEGGQPRAYREENYVKVFELTAKPVKWNILDNVAVTAFTYNRTLPGPMIRITEGDQVRIVVRNELPDATTIHWHRLEVPCL